MEFVPHFKRKRSNSKDKIKIAPFPLCAEGQRGYQGVFTGLCVEVVDTEQARIRTLHDNGCYGKGSCSRGGPVSGEADETLLLGLEEACLLTFFLEVLEIRDVLGNVMDWNSYMQAALEYDKDFPYKLAAYLYLKSKNWIIKSGIKFGGDFLIYKHGPREFHASFLVLVQTPAENIHSHYAAKNLKGVQRVAETSDKDVLVLSVNQFPDFEPKLATPTTLQSLTIQETVIRRFNYSAFVQTKQTK
ncbi:tRNA-splicing endonuclease subunit Sen2-1 [Drosophila grimshawi]|uniref:tRNA-intron lyase n=1 Tax=Drosophila grimshawi TaxID=7222 RepID=B4JEH8_DROGR|nr:tRNA-splicing endonuclease subunit Sen2-1 [Drosophila grimshawi]EDW03698.1 GH11377 [Drosophila grimshawi]